jgi:hypothetical protein
VACAAEGLSYVWLYSPHQAVLSRGNGPSCMNTYYGIDPRSVGLILSFPSVPPSFFFFWVVLGFEISLNKYKNIKIISCVLSDHSGIKLEIISQGN